MSQDLDASPEPPASEQARLSPALALLRQQALQRQAAHGKLEGDPASEEGDSAAPGWIRGLPAAGWWLLALQGAGSVVFGVAAFGRFPTESLVLALLLSAASTAMLTLPGLYLLRGALGPWAAARRMSARTVGFVDGDATTVVPGDGDWLECPGVSYAYEAGGCIRRGTLTATTSSNVAVLVRRARARLPAIGATVTVRYDPAAADRSAVVGHEPGLGCMTWLAAGCLALGVALAVLFLQLRDVRPAG